MHIEFCYAFCVKICNTNASDKMNTLSYFIYSTAKFSNKQEKQCLIVDIRFLNKRAIIEPSHFGKFCYSIYYS